jgi:hypothetical protein
MGLFDIDHFAKESLANAGRAGPEPQARTCANRSKVTQLMRGPATTCVGAQERGVDGASAWTRRS